MSRMTNRQKRRNKFNIKNRSKIRSQYELNYLLNQIVEAPSSQDNFLASLHENVNNRENKPVTPLADMWSGFIEAPAREEDFTDLSTVCPLSLSSGSLKQDDLKRSRLYGWFIFFNRNLYGPFKSREEAAAYTKLEYENTIISRKTNLRIRIDPDYMKLCTQHYSSFNAWQNMLNETRREFGHNYDPLSLIHYYRQHLVKKHIKTKKIYQRLKDENLLEIDVISVLSECGLEVDATRLKMVLEQYMKK